MQLRWMFKRFNELTATELYAIMQLRNEVFVVEQNCIYQDADNNDESSFHLAAWDKITITAYCRILPPGLAFPEASIGRVVSSPAYRKAGIGRELMQQAIAKTLQQFNCKAITIGAQQYLENFYTGLGFIKIGEPYLEDSIPHIHMQYQA